MISIIVCSRKPRLSSVLQQNIEKTIGTNFEIITIDNSKNDISIFSAYNTGVKKSNFPYLCFMHDDISYESLNWGNCIINHFSDPLVGAVGISGTAYYPYMPCSWWGSSIIYEHLLQSTQSDKRPALKSSKGNLKKREVVAFDGAWFCIRKNLFAQISFDEANYHPFHFYDIDICMQMYQASIKMYCITDILIHHTSIGDLSNDWIESVLVFRKKWKMNLPAKCIEMGHHDLCMAEYRALNEFIWICKSNGISSKTIYSMAIQSLFSFKRGYFFYKTPAYLLKFLFHYYK